MNADKNDDQSVTGTWYTRLRGVLKGEPATRDDLLDLLRDPRWHDVLEPDERTMLLGVLEVSEAHVRDVMIPRSHMVVLEKSAAKEEVLKTITESGHSRFPVIGDDRDQVVGILLAKDVLSYFIMTPDESFDFQRFLRPATFIPESKRLNTLLEEFRVSRNHIAIVVDEYGGTSGLLTIEDVLEEIVGEIDDEHDPLEAAQIQRQDDDRYSVRALTRIDDFNDHFDVAFSDENYDTVGGLVIHELGRMPRRGESVELGGFRFKVTQADRRRVHTLEVRPVETQADDGATPTP
ncbi:MAG: HlyC/CorC family transporter [Gammaproteobacteria bacterium]